MKKKDPIKVNYGDIPTSYISLPEATWYMYLPWLKPVALNLGQEISDDQGSIGLPKGFIRNVGGNGQ